MFTLPPQIAVTLSLSMVAVFLAPPPPVVVLLSPPVVVHLPPTVVVLLLPPVVVRLPLTVVVLLSPPVVVHLPPTVVVLLSPPVVVYLPPTVVVLLSPPVVIRLPPLFHDADAAVEVEAESTTINTGECCKCFETYEDVRFGRGEEWVECAWGRWIHEKCIDKVVLDAEGKEKFCSFCVSHFCLNPLKCMHAVL